MPTSRPLVVGDRFIALCSPLTIGESYVFELRSYQQAAINAAYVVLCSDFTLPSRGVNDWWTVVGARVFGIANCASKDPRLISAIRRGTAPALYVREGDTVEPWSSYQAVLLERRMRALTERHADFMNRLRHHGAGHIQLRVEDDVVIIQCSGTLPDPAILGPNTPEGVRVETSLSVDYLELETAVIADILQHNRPLHGLNFPSNHYHTTDQQRQMAERLAAAMNISLSIRTAELAEIGITPPPAPPAPPPPPPPPPTRFNLLECDLPAVAPPPAKQKNFDALAELQAEFRAAKVTAKTTVQPALTRFDLLECDEPVEPVVVKPKWSAPQSPKQQPAPQQRRTVEDILDLTTSGPLEAFIALQIVKAEIKRDLWQKETN